jgi:yeast amino acid transporter
MMIFIFPALLIVWKLVYRTKFCSPTEADLQQDVAGIEEYTRNYAPEPAK